MEATRVNGSNRALNAAAACLLGFALSLPAMAEKNPCAAKNPCAMKNPCSAKNPCGAASVDPKLVTRPSGSKPFSASHAVLVAEGERLWKSTTLSTNGMACETCHKNGGAFSASFAKPYPHAVGMPQAQSGIRKVDAEQMVQFCMVVPMAAKPLAWDSRELAALTAYTGEAQKAFIKTSARPASAPANPCAAGNPCAGKKPH